MMYPEINISMIKNKTFCSPIELISKKSEANSVRHKHMVVIEANNTPFSVVIGLHNLKSITRPVNVTAMVAIELINNVSSHVP